MELTIEEINNLANNNDVLIARNDKLVKTLEEIIVIAGDAFKVCDDDCGNARKIKLIIDKINEVLNEIHN